MRKDGDDYIFDILDPHNPAPADNFEKALGFAKFAEQYDHLDTCAVLGGMSIQPNLKISIAGTRLYPAV